jgi:hypothetical protein
MDKPDEEFAWHRREKGQRDTYCRPCRAKYKREHYLANKQRYIDAAARLEFDHLRDKEFAIAAGIGTATGTTSSTRLQSATSFVQTVTGAAPRSGAASHARR